MTQTYLNYIQQNKNISKSIYLWFYATLKKTNFKSL